MIAVGGICPLPEGDEKPSVYIEIHPEIMFWGCCYGDI